MYVSVTTCVRFLVYVLLYVMYMVRACVCVCMYVCKGVCSIGSFISLRIISVCICVYMRPFSDYCTCAWRDVHVT